MALRVHKYGGSSVSTPEQIKDIAKRLKLCRDQGHQIIAVVSAMGKTTDQLVQLAAQVSAAPNRRELDMLLTTGERVTMALLSMALHDLDVPAISFTGSQAGVLTDGSHSNARIQDVKPTRVREELNKNRIVVLAGFQGVDPHTREITTLGRGGSDTTAVAMAAHFKAERCEILKDVEGVFSADPRIVTSPRHLPELTYEQMLEITFWGAKVLHYRCVELASRLDIPILIALAHGEGRHTRIQKESQMFEDAQVISVNSHEHVFAIELKSKNVALALEEFQQFLSRHHLPWPQVLGSDQKPDHTVLYVTGPVETLRSFENLEDLKVLANDLSTVTATSYGSTSNETICEMMAKLEKERINIHRLQMSSLSVSAFLHKNDRARAVQVLHDLVR